MPEPTSPVETLLTVASSRHGPAAHDGISTEDPGVTHDHLRHASDAVRFLEDNSVPVPRAPLTPASLADLRRLRDAVVMLLQRDSVAPAAVLLKGTTYRLDDEGRLDAVASGWPGFVGRLLPGLIELRREREHLKVCANPACRWLFLDRSKNHARLWCDMAVCGNRAKARRYADRHR
jgi:hypothetical protein